MIEPTLDLMGSEPFSPHIMGAALTINPGMAYAYVDADTGKVRNVRDALPPHLEELDKGVFRDILSIHQNYLFVCTRATYKEMKGHPGLRNAYIATIGQDGITFIGPLGEVTEQRITSGVAYERVRDAVFHSIYNEARRLKKNIFVLGGSIAYRYFSGYYSCFYLSTVEITATDGRTANGQTLDLRISEVEGRHSRSGMHIINTPSYKLRKIL